MEDGENGAERLWNGYNQEKTAICLKKMIQNAIVRARCFFLDPIQTLFNFLIVFLRKIDNFSRV